MAVGLSALWAIGAVVVLVVGAAIAIAGGDDPSDEEGFLVGIGITVATGAALTLAFAIGGIILGRRLRRGRDGARAGLVVMFLLFALVSAMFLASAVADESGADPGGIVGFGLNTVLCLAVALSALLARPGT